jgi:hypothetical protein
MRKIISALILALSAVAPAALAQVPNTRLINMVDTPATITYSASGEGRVPLDPSVGNIIKVNGFRKFSVLIGTTRATSMMLFIGKISGPTLSQRFTQPVDAKIHTFDVVGPEMTLWLTGGPPNTTERVQLWVYFTS